MWVAGLTVGIYVSVLCVCTACELYGLLGGIFGFCSINTLAVISLDRYMVIAMPFYAMKHVSHKRSLLQILVVWLWSTLWATPPMLKVGLSRYIPEGFQTSCSFDYLSRDLKNVLFVQGMFWFGFVFPVLIIACCYVGIIRAVSSQSREMRKTAEKMGAKTTKSEKDKKQDIAMAKVAAGTISLFIISWLPYALVAMMGVLGQRQFVTPYTCQVPVMCAKASAMWNPIVYALSHPRFRAALEENIPWLLLCKGRNTDHGGQEAKSQDGATQAQGAKKKKRANRASARSDTSEDTDIEMTSVANSQGAVCDTPSAKKTTAMDANNSNSTHLKPSVKASASTTTDPASSDTQVTTLSGEGVALPEVSFQDGATATQKPRGKLYILRRMVAAYLGFRSGTGGPATRRVEPGEDVEMEGGVRTSEAAEAQQRQGGGEDAGSDTSSQSALSWDIPHPVLAETSQMAGAGSGARPPHEDTITCQPQSTKSHEPLASADSNCEDKVALKDPAGCTAADEAKECSELVVTSPVSKPAVTSPVSEPAVTSPVSDPAVTSPVSKPAVTSPESEPAVNMPVSEDASTPSEGGHPPSTAPVCEGPPLSVTVNDLEEQPSPAMAGSQDTDQGHTPGETQGHNNAALTSEAEDKAMPLGTDQTPQPPVHVLGGHPPHQPHSNVDLGSTTTGAAAPTAAAQLAAGEEATESWRREDSVRSIEYEPGFV